MLDNVLYKGNYDFLIWFVYAMLRFRQVKQSFLSTMNTTETLGELCIMYKNEHIPIPVLAKEDFMPTSCTVSKLNPIVSNNSCIFHGLNWLLKKIALHSFASSISGEWLKVCNCESHSLHWKEFAIFSFCMVKCKGDCITLIISFSNSSLLALLAGANYKCLKACQRIIIMWQVKSYCLLPPSLVTC